MRGGTGQGGWLGLEVVSGEKVPAGSRSRLLMGVEVEEFPEEKGMDFG